MQGFCLNSKNIQDFLCKLRRKLKELCDRLINGIIASKVINNNHIRSNSVTIHNCSTSQV
jgi:hypothetical protein